MRLAVFFLLILKIFIKFDSKFWGDEEWIVHAHERRGYYPTFLNVEADGMYPTGTNMLVAIVTGEESKRIEHQPKWETKAEIEKVRVYGVCGGGGG